MTSPLNPIDQVPLVAYILALTLTPGPSALLIAAAGARFGIGRCTPHLAGSLLGWELQLLAAAAGIGAAVLGHPPLRLALQLASTAYLLWLGWRVLGARPQGGTRAAEPLGWREAATLQLSNPKSWLTALASAGLFLPSAATLEKKGAFMFYAGAAGVGGLAAWALFGAALQHWLRRPSSQATLNRAMATALAATALWGLRGALQTFPGFERGAIGLIS